MMFNAFEMLRSEKFVIRRWMLLLCLIPYSSASALEGFDWNVWRSLPVQNGGRQKPLDTVASESLRNWANRATIADPETKDSLEPIEVYLTMLFEWRGWDHAELAQLERSKDWRPFYFHLHQPDKWDVAPLFRVDHLPLRTALDLDESQNEASPLQLDKARVKDRRTEREMPFSAWADQLREASESGENLTDLEQKGLEL